MSLAFSGRRHSRTKQARILIVEDEAIIALDLKKTVERLGHVVTATAETGTRAITLATGAPPDLVLMDVSLKGEIDGIAAAEEIHSRLAVPIVFLSAHVIEPRLHGACLPADAPCLLKPFAQGDLEDAIARALEQAGRPLDEARRSARVVHH